MISTDNPLAGWFLLLTGGGFFLFYALPLLLVPLRWARVFRWEVGAAAPNLTLYFGRCLGAVAVAITLMMLRAAADPRGHRIVLELTAAVAGLMTGLHIYGAVRRVQPWTEDAEILLYGAVLVLSLWLRSTLR